MSTITLYFDLKETTYTPLFAWHVESALRAANVIQKDETVRPYRVILHLTKDGACRLEKDWMVGRAKGGFNAQQWADQYGTAESVAQRAPHNVTVYTRSGGYPGHAQLHPPPSERPGYPHKIVLREDEVAIHIDEPDTVKIPETLTYYKPETYIIKGNATD